MNGISINKWIFLALASPSLVWGDAGQKWCTQPVLLGEKTMILGQTSIEQIDQLYGFSERFRVSESSFPSTCYQHGEVFLTFSFRDWGKERALAGISISALPPYDGRACPRVSGQTQITLNGNLIGQAHPETPGAMIQRSQKMRLLAQKGTFECHFFENTVYFKNALIRSAVSITENN